MTLSFAKTVKTYSVNTISNSQIQIIIKKLNMEFTNNPEDKE